MNVTEISSMFVVQDQKNRLFFLVTVPIEATFRAFLKDLVGEDNILTYHQFMEMTH